MIVLTLVSRLAKNINRSWSVLNGLKGVDLQGFSVSKGMASLIPFHEYILSNLKGNSIYVFLNNGDGKILRSLTVI